MVQYRLDQENFISERVSRPDFTIFETKLGLMAQIMIGAIFVGSMETVWAGEIKSTNKV